MALKTAIDKSETTTRGMTDSHKQALAVGREQGRAIRRYLEALESHRPKRGRKRTPESIEKRLLAVKDQLENATGVSQLELVQERMDLQAELANRQTATDLSQFEEEFVAAAADYGLRKGISYAAWREVGVDAAVLKRAGISRAVN